VLAHDIDTASLEFARINGTVSGHLTKENVSECDVILISIYPEEAIDYMREMAPYFGAKPVVIDCCGTKRKITKIMFPLAEQYGFTYVGCHPMAGTHNSGFKYARSNLFHNAPMVIVPPDFNDILLLDRVKELLAPAEFGRFTVCTAEKHDEVIAFTSQMAHIISNAYIKSPTAGTHNGFSAGSYKDLTRVAWLNPDMWAELFLENKEYLLPELETLIHSLNEYKTALEQEDFETMERLLDEGAKRKAEVDGH